MFTVARVQWPEGDVQFFASMDGELFLGVSRKPTSKDEQDIAKLFDVTPTGGGATIPMRVTRGLLRQYGGTFTEVGRSTNQSAGR